MKKKTEATGLESAVITHWSGWDGDGVEWMYFYDVNLIPIIHDTMKQLMGMSEGIIDLEVEINKLQATIRIYDREQENKEIFTCALKLKVSAELIN